MNLRLIVLGTELLRITTEDDAEVEELDGSGYTAATIVGFTPSVATGWHNPLHEPGWADE